MIAAKKTERDPGFNGRCWPEVPILTTPVCPRKVAYLLNALHQQN